MNERHADPSRAAQASLGEAVISTDAEGRVVFLNAVAEALTGWSQREAVNRPLDEIFRRQAAGKRAVLLARDGREYPIEDSTIPMRNPHGAVIGNIVVFRDATDLRRADRERAELAAIVDSSGDAILSKTLEGIIRSWNAGASRVFGYSAEEMIGKSVTLLIPPERIAEEAAILDRIRRGEAVEHFETVRVGKDGRRLDISLSVSPVKDADGQIIGASKIARDVTDRKLAEEALRNSEGRNRFLAELATSTQTLTDPSEMVATTARLLVEHLGVDRCAYAEIEDERVFVINGDYTRGVASIVGRWPIAAFGVACERAMLANEPYLVTDVESDVRITPTDRTAYQQTAIRAVICVPLHKDGKLVAAMAVHQQTARVWTQAEIDSVTTVVARSWESIERARATRGQKETADHLAFAMAAANLGDWQWGAGSDVVNLSARGAEIYGIPPGPHMTRAVMLGMLHDDDRPHAKLAFERAIAARQSYDVEYRIRRPDGKEVWVSAKGRAKYDASGTVIGMYGVVQDISERKRLDQELRQRAEELAMADRKKDEFIALLAHELRNPLAPVRTGLQVLMLAENDPVASAKARETMERQLGHMVRLIDDLLDASRVGQNKLNLQRTRVLLSEVVSHALEAAGPAIQAARHEVRVSLPATPIPLDADLTRLAQVFGNLLTNSAKYTQRGGHIWLDATVREAFVVVTVRDDGIGIPRDALPRIFDMFSQVDRSIERTTGGLGIGLALVKGLVEMHGGTVTAESAGSGQGSTFSVRLPLAVRERPRSSPHLRTVNAAAAKRRVLIADDNEDAAATMADLLRLGGHEVEIVADGVDAVAKAETMLPDLILMDMGMPRLSGLEATKQIRAHAWGKAMTIVALTGWGQASDREKSRVAGCDAHLVKPVSMPELRQLLAELPRSSE